MPYAVIDSGTSSSKCGRTRQGFHEMDGASIANVIDAAEAETGYPNGRSKPNPAPKLISSIRF